MSNVTNPAVGIKNNASKKEKSGIQQPVDTRMSQTKTEKPFKFSEMEARVKKIRTTPAQKRKINIYKIN